jgi:hypothetical protein
MAIPKEPAELEARLLSTVLALRQIRDTLQGALELTEIGSTPPPALAAASIRSIAELCVSHAEHAVMAATS